MVHNRPFTAKCSHVSLGSVGLTWCEWLLTSPQCGPYVLIRIARNAATTCLTASGWQHESILIDLCDPPLSNLSSGKCSSTWLVRESGAPRHIVYSYPLAHDRSLLMDSLS